MLDVLERIVTPDKGVKSLDDIARGDVGQIEDCLSLFLARDVLASRREGRGMSARRKKIRLKACVWRR